MSKRAERRRTERKKGSYTTCWIYFKPIDLVKKKATIQLGDKGGPRLLAYLQYAMADLMERYGITNINIEINVKEENAGKLTDDEKAACDLGNSIVYHPPELEAVLPGYGER